jgi:hypothetical protein
MSFLIFLQNLPLPTLLAVTVLIGLLLCWGSLALGRVGVRLSGAVRAKGMPINDLVTVTSILFALMLSFSAAGIWNDWVQASGTVQREALALENVLALADGLSPDRAAKVKERIIAYAKAAAAYEWPAMARLPCMRPRPVHLRSMRLFGLAFLLMKSAGRRSANWATPEVETRIAIDEPHGTRAA